MERRSMRSKKRAIRTSVRKSPWLLFALSILPASTIQGSEGEKGMKAIPVFMDGEAQIVPEFADSSSWIRHDLWVETEFDSDKDGKKDRMHVAVTRPKQTETEGLKLPIVYETSPYFAGTGSTNPQHFWIRGMHLAKSLPSTKIRLRSKPESSVL